MLLACSTWGAWRLRHPSGTAYRKINERLARDLQNEFPGVEGFSPRDFPLHALSLADAWPETEMLQQLIAKLPWGHNIRVLDKVKDRATREWYLRAALEYGWSQNVLVRSRSTASSMSGKGRLSPTSSVTLPPPGSDSARQILKDPYNFDFLSLAKDAEEEREIERGLLLHLRDLLPGARPRLCLRRQPGSSRRWPVTPSTWTCSSTTFACTAILSSY